MSALIPMHFEGAAIRVIEDGGEPWFVGKDVCEALGYTNHNKALGDHCKGVTKRYPLETPGGVQDLRVISEPDVLRLIVNSKLPAAERFEHWVFEEVLPAIRRTGGYSLGKPVFRSLAPEFKAALSIAKTAGLKGNQATLSAAKAVKRFHGVDPLEAVGITHLGAAVQVRHCTPTELGKQHFDESAQAFNKRLERSGLQIKNINGNWQPTPRGEEFAVLLDAGKQHSDGTPIQQLRWLETVIKALPEEAAA
jgi:prophage antirepressor-like protein